MKRAKKFAALTLAVLYLVFGTGLAYADTKPYIKVYGGDVFAGGWFNNTGTACSSAAAAYQAPTFSPLANQYKGGILAFATSDRKGSSVDFGALAMGLIQGDNPNQYGFYSGQTANVSGLSFANTNNVSAGYWGGYLAGASQQTHCLPDYFGTKQNSGSSTPAPTPGGSSFNIGALPSGKQYLAPAGTTSDVTAGGDATVANGTAITVFVNGNAYISHNITYQAGYTADNIPKFALVVKGNIYIDPAVSRIDGLYIAQPSSGTSDGNVWTCHDGSNTTPDGYWIRTNCGSRLNINGALIAKQVNLLRISGDIGDNNSNPAEVINYIPAMVLGGAFFNQPPNQNPRINGLISLPPVF